jgi:hypothetical protein
MAVFRAGDCIIGHSLCDLRIARAQRDTTANPSSLARSILPRTSIRSGGERELSLDLVRSSDRSIRSAPVTTIETSVVVAASANLPAATAAHCVELAALRTVEATVLFWRGAAPSGDVSGARRAGFR